MTAHHTDPGQPAAPSDESLRACLSGLADGEADGSSSQAACTAWRERADMRQTWHAYQLIGDVLRSDELARPAAHDADFLARLRTRLADEPVVMAPMPEAIAAAPRPRRQAWMFPAAAAAGFVVVAGVLVVTRLSAPDPAASGVLQAGAFTAPAPATVPNFTAGAEMIRDARLDAYINAHQAARGGGAMAVPGTGLRNADVSMPAGTGQ
jgi:sigma-E factor negative regulatory protein RseA